MDRKGSKGGEVGFDPTKNNQKVPGHQKRERRVSESFHAEGRMRASYVCVCVWTAVANPFASKRDGDDSFDLARTEREKKERANEGEQVSHKEQEEFKKRVQKPLLVGGLLKFFHLSANLVLIWFYRRRQKSSKPNAQCE